MPATRVEVNIPGEVAYDVRIGDGVLAGLGEWCRRVSAVASCPKLAVVSDSNVAPLYLPAAKASLEAAGYSVCDIVIEAGEQSKSCEVIAEVWSALAELGMSRDCAVVALGGGVVGDLAGFAGSTFMRGIPIVQVPTTLLSMVDSSVGGKTGINLDSGKNLVGTFTQPSYVCASTDVLATLPEREWACGCGEVAKSAVIDSDDFLFWLMANASALRARESDMVAEAVKRCVVFKAGVVARDKTESCGVRECLNYGHTLAHAIETMCGYGRYSHGAAVAEGMRFAAFLGARVAGVSGEFADAQAQLLNDLGLLPLNWVEAAASVGGGKVPSARDVIDCMKRDKKARGGALRFVLASDVGVWSVERVDDAVVAAALSDLYRI